MIELKTAADVPALVDALMAESEDVTAIGDDSYCVVDVRDDVNARIETILNDFGPRDHLFYDIIVCLKLKGRDYVLPDDLAG